MGSQVGKWMDVRKRLWRTSHTLLSLHGVQWCLGQTGCTLVPGWQTMENARELVLPGTKTKRTSNEIGVIDNLSSQLVVFFVFFLCMRFA